MDQTIYLGPYLKVRMEQVKENTTFAGCPKIDCARWGTETKEKFCFSCGTLIDTKMSKSITQDKFDIHEITDKSDESLYEAYMDLDDDAEHVLLPNTRSDYKARDFDLISDGDALIEDYHLTLKPELEIEWFKGKYKEEIKDFETHLKEVKVGWGLIRYWS